MCQRWRSNVSASTTENKSAIVEEVGEVEQAAAEADSEAGGTARVDDEVTEDDGGQTAVWTERWRYCGGACQVHAARHTLGQWAVQWRRTKYVVGSTVLTTREAAWYRPVAYNMRKNWNIDA